MLGVRNISKVLGDFHLEDISFSVEKGTYFVLLGGSGSGKSVLLEILSGIIRPDSGHLTLEEKDITTAPIQKRRLAMVYQDQALLPHLTVFENIAYPLRCTKIPSSLISKKVGELAALVEVSALLKRKPLTLSGGEAQRVALARALASDPVCLLLDEPLSNVDTPLRYGLRRLLRRINASGQTIIHVTHDFEEALSLADELAVIENGRIVQQGTPEDVFSSPKSEFTAHFTGIRNFFRGKLTSGHINNDIKCFTIKSTTFSVATDAQDGEGYLIIPTESVIISEDKIENQAVNLLQGEVVDYFPTRAGIEIVVKAGDLLISGLMPKGTLWQRDELAGKKVWLYINSLPKRFIPL